jgi:DNA-binding MarR family transcriptional regulator
VTDAGADLGHALDRLSTLLRRLAQPRDMSLTSNSTLRTLGDDGPQRVVDLARREGISQPAMTQLLTRLEREGFVDRLGDDDDARVVRVHLTRAGAERLESRRAQRAEQLTELLAQLSDADRAAIARALPALVRLSEQDRLAGAAR